MEQVSCDVKLFLIQFSIKTKTLTNNDIVQALYKNSHWRLGTFSAACTDNISFLICFLRWIVFAKLKSSAGFYFLMLTNCS